mgnify:CR=1 FL=1
MPNKDMIAVIQRAAEALSPAMWSAHGAALQDADSRMRGEIPCAASARRARVCVRS